MDEYLLDVFGPDLAGAVLEHLVVLALGGDDGLAGGLALCRVEGGWMIHGVWGETGGREGPFIWVREEGLGRRKG